MLIAILVLLGLAGAIWYFARKQTQAVITLTQEDVNSTSTTNESAFTTPEVAAEKEFIQAQQDALAKAQEVAAAEAVPSPVVTPVEEAPAVETKPKKKKRYYKPKAK
jgi:cytoskeletal protein RodZ